MFLLLSSVLVFLESFIDLSVLKLEYAMVANRVGGKNVILTVVLEK
jgi:hypothetical protein